MDHHQWCLFAIHHTIVHSPASGRLQGSSGETASAFVFVGSAEGTVSVWDLTKLLQEWITEKAAHFRHVGSERNEAMTASQASPTEATSLAGTLTNIPRQSPTPAGTQKEPPECHQNVSPTTPDLSLPSVPLQEGDSEALVCQLAQRLEFSAVSSETEGEKDITESTEGSAVVPLLPDSVSSYDPAAEMTKKTPGKEEGGGGSSAVKLSPSLVLSVHQSGVNTVDVCLVDGKECLYMVLSGGDDTAITASLCRLHPQNIAVVTRKTHPSAHFSAVTGKLEVLADLPQYWY